MFSSLNRLILKGGTKSNRLISYFIAFMVSSLAIFTMWLNPGLFEDVEGSLLDTRFQLRGPIDTSGLVVLVSIDEKSIDLVGRWPWSREVVAQLIDDVNALGAYTIGLDIIFSEPQPSSISNVLNLDTWSEDERGKLEAFAQQNNPDTILATSLFMAGNVVNGQFFYEDADVGLRSRLSPEEIDVILQSSRVSAVKSRSDDFRSIEYRSVRHNIPFIAQAGAGAGFFNQIPSRDGVVRNSPLVIKYNDNFYPSLALKSLSLYLDDAPIVVHANEFAIEKVTIGNDLEVPSTESGFIPINYRGPKGTIKTYSAVDVLNGEVPASEFQDKLVLIGSTAIGVFDSHASPYGAEFPGLEVQANVIESIINGDSIKRTDFHMLFDFLTIFVICMLLAFFIPRMPRTPTRFLFFLMLFSLLVYGNYYAFSEMNIWLNILFPMLAMVFCFVFLMLYQAFMVEARYSHVRTAFKSYLSPALVDQLTANPDLLNFGGEEKELSILFSDIRAFTNLSETVTPSELSRFLQAYMDPMTDKVLKNNGTLDKYIGDAVMAIFGAPVPFDTHPIDACQSALEMIEALDFIVETVPDLERLFPIKIGVGVHTGTVVVGNLGSSQHFNYTVIGDAVNLASRIESLTKGYGVDVMISEVTYERVKHVFVCRELDLVRVKGKQEPVGLYELIGRSVTDEQKEFLLIWEQALAAYRQRNFGDSKSIFERFLKRKPNDLTAKTYIERCEHFIEHPVADDWDGVFTHTSK